MPWIIGRDFNTILNESESKRGDFNKWYARAFNFIIKAKVVDIPLRGVEFTWSNNREKGSCEELDRERPLGRRVGLEEVWKVVSNCDGNKAPRPDGFNLNFIKENWDAIKQDFMSFMVEFHKNGSIVKELNQTFIALIPKCSNLKTMKDYRPISLVGSLYKILAKVLANRMRRVLDSVVRESQMAFVKNRQILDNFIIADEIIHHWKKSYEWGLFECVVQENGDKGVDEGCHFGIEAVRVLHLQFTDDTILFPQPKIEYLLNVRRIMRCFELALGLHINFQKTCLVKVGKRRNEEEDWAAIFSVSKRIEGLQRSFFWGDGCEKRKIHAVKWESLCKERKRGGLGIGSILHKNKGLLAKWVWRFGKEESPLWKRVICAKYGVLMNALCWNWNGGPSSSFFMKAIGSLFSQGSKTAKILQEGLRVIVGCGNKASLWWDIKVEGVPLKEAFPRIFALAINK
ncbi:hypothetical protein Ddye_015805 [Dipteronia dyeriana]|uniref:Reverse transcriptase domain-containing protein n=1 Tax=Dipteronia dyeriana TaxID=168575 RepID=A0AAD9WYW4_9ROSI|nr:hypothetical protein Ddye_015805 [Dipteronia dyeriana]